jgi:hypothetical protein
MLVTGAGLLIRKPWGWRLATGAQFLAGITQVALASMGLVMIHRASGDYAGFGVMAGQALFAVAAFLAAISFIGCWYVTRPHVKAVFGFDTLAFSTSTLMVSRGSRSSMPRASSATRRCEARRWTKPSIPPEGT